MLYELFKDKKNQLINNNINSDFNSIEKISIQSLGFKYSEKSNYLFDNINLNIEKGDIIGISGENGSGKTTLCNILLSLIPPSNGKIIVNDKFNIFENISNYRRLISFVPQHIFLFNDILMISVPIQSGEKYQIEDITYNLDKDVITMNKNYFFHNCKTNSDSEDSDKDDIDDKNNKKPSKNEKIEKTEKENIENLFKSFSLFT